MRSSRSLKRGNKSSSPGREMKDKTKRRKCFGCEHISFHFLLLGTNNSLSFLGGVGEVQVDICAKIYLRCLTVPMTIKGKHPASLTPFPTSFYTLDAGWGRYPESLETAHQKPEGPGEGAFVAHCQNASSPSLRHILFAQADGNLSLSH